MINVLVTGSDGQLGNELKVLSNNILHFNFFFHDKDTLDITNIDQITDFFNDHSIDFCINCAAYTAVDKAEEDTVAAEEINVMAVENLAFSCHLHNTTLIHISTDFVFDGLKSRPYTEDDECNPLSVYGRTKRAGEIKALEINPKTIIIRTSWLYSSFGNNFVKTMIKYGAQLDELKVVYDQVGTPTNAKDLAEAIISIIEQFVDGVKEDVFGIYHYSNEGVASWYDFAQAIFEVNDCKALLFPISTEYYPTAAKRPSFSVINKKKVKHVFGVRILHWRESLYNFFLNQL